MALRQRSTQPACETDSISDFGKFAPAVHAINERLKIAKASCKRSPGIKPAGDEDRYMSNVLRFRNTDDGLGAFASGGRSSASYAVLHPSVQIARISALQAQAKEDISAAILLLDIALIHGRLASLKVDDQEIRRRLDDGLRVIAELLAIARAKAADL